MGAILVIDRLGRVVMDSRSLVPAEANYSGHDFFQVHAGRSDAGLFISRPWVAPDGQYLIGLSRRITNDDGSFGGVVAGSMRVSYFHSLFRKLSFGAKDSMTLLSADGTLLMRAPFDIDMIGQSLRKSTVFKQFPRVQSGWYETASILDGEKRLFVFQQVGHHPMLIINGVSLDTIYAEWWREAWLIGSIMLALCAVTMALTVFLVNALKRRTAAENKLALSIAQCIAGGTRRASDLGVRYGGEEFAVLLPGETGQGAFLIAEEIRASVLSLRVQQQGRPDICPTISVGVAVMIPQVGLTPGELIKSADLALYEAKRSGRNRTVAAPTMASAHHVAA
jgi:hypothetical protein